MRIAMKLILGKYLIVWVIFGNLLEHTFFTMFKIDWMFFIWWECIFCHFTLLIWCGWYSMLYFWLWWLFYFFVCFASCGLHRVTIKEGKVGKSRWNNGSYINLRTCIPFHKLCNGLSSSGFWHHMRNISTFMSSRALIAKSMDKGELYS